MDNAILVYCEDGVAKHRFCPESEARAFLTDASSKMEGGSMFALDCGNAKLVFDISPNLRDKVGEAKAKLLRDMRIKAAMDRNGIPQDRELRIAICKTFAELLD